MEKNTKSSFKKSTSKLIISLTTITIFVYLISNIITSQINMCNQSPYVPNRETCNCSCWDRVVKGCYFRNIFDTEYKHIYINATSQSFQIVLLTILYFTLLIRILDSIVYNVIFKFHSLDYLALLPIVANIYPIFYGFWVHINYINDEFLDLVGSQVFFNITETVVVLSLLPFISDKGKLYMDWKKIIYLITFSIAVVHILLTSRNGLKNAVEGILLLITRDFFLIFGDIVTINCSLIVFWRHRKNMNDKHLILFLIIVFGLFIWFKLVTIIF